MKTIRFFFVVVVLSSNFLYIQAQICGNRNSENPIVPNQLYKSTLSWRIPVIFHVIKSSDGTGDVLDSQ